MCSVGGTSGTLAPPQSTVDVSNKAPEDLLLEGWEQGLVWGAVAAILSPGEKVTRVPLSKIPRTNQGAIPQQSPENQRVHQASLLSNREGGHSRNV